MVSFTLWSTGSSLQSVGYSPGVLNPTYAGNSLEWWLLFIFNNVGVATIVWSFAAHTKVPHFIKTIPLPDMVSIAKDVLTTVAINVFTTIIIMYTALPTWA